MSALVAARAGRVEAARAIVVLVQLHVAECAKESSAAIAGDHGLFAVVIEAAGAPAFHDRLGAAPGRSRAKVGGEDRRLDPPAAVRAAGEARRVAERTRERMAAVGTGDGTGAHASFTSGA